MGGVGHKGSLEGYILYHLWSRAEQGEAHQCDAVSRAAEACRQPPSQRLSVNRKTSSSSVNYGNQQSKLLEDSMQFKEMKLLQNCLFMTGKTGSKKVKNHQKRSSTATQQSQVMMKMCSKFSDFCCLYSVFTNEWCSFKS